jgi:hypothetical protein
VRARLESVFEPPNSFGQAFSQLGQLARAEQKDSDCQEYEQVPGLQQVFEHRFSETRIEPSAPRMKRFKVESAQSFDATRSVA